MGRFILRAEVRWNGATTVSYAYDLTPGSVFVVSDCPAPAGSALWLRLSFPGVLEPLDVEAHVARVRPDGAPGEPGGLELAFAASSRIATLLARLDDGERPRSERAYRVLLIEDSSFMHDMFAFAVEQFFGGPGVLAIDHAEDAERAWDKLSREPYDLVIVDYFLPAEDGASLIARMRRDARLARLPVVAISIGGRNAREATLSAGADLFLDKPLVLRDLFNTLRVLSHQRRGRGEGERILVLDDSPLVLALTRAALEQAGFRVAVAETLSRFEQARVEFEPDLILVDVQMPEAFGDDVASTLRGFHGVQVPIVLVSSLEEDELARRAAEAHANGYIRKSEGMTELVRRCREVLDGASP
jgi:DNA-binding response OmpR family regulator